MATKKKAGMKLADLTASPRNPRKIDAQNQKGLADSLKEFGDLSGIVYNKRDGTLVGGHQRVEVLRREFGEGLEIVDGFIQLPGDLGAVRVREVDWDEITADAARIAANNQALQGKFTLDVFEMIEDVENARPDLADKLALRLVEVDGADEEEKAGKPDDEDGVPGMDLAPFEHYDYVLVLARSTSDWFRLAAFLGLERVNASPIAGKKKIGLARGICASKLLAMFEEHGVEIPQPEIEEDDDEGQ
jgi:hypothetical protein